jgi:hypothetical protein
MSKQNFTHHHITGFGMAMGLPIADAIARCLACARELSASAEKISYAQDFGSQIAQAVRRKMPRPAAAAVYGKDDDNDSFAKLLIKAVQRKLGQKARYTQPR